MEPVLYQKTTSAHGICLGVWLMYNMTLHLRSLIFFLSEQLSITIASQCLLLFLVWFEPLQVLCMISVSVSSNVYKSCWILKTLFTWSHLPYLALTIFLLYLFRRSLRLEGRSLLQMSSLRLSVPKSLTLYILNLWVFVLIIATARRSFSGESQSTGLFYFM